MTHPFKVHMTLASLIHVIVSIQILKMNTIFVNTTSVLIDFCLPNLRFLLTAFRNIVSYPRNVFML